LRETVSQFTNLLLGLSTGQTRAVVVSSLGVFLCVSKIKAPCGCYC